MEIAVILDVVGRDPLVSASSTADGRPLFVTRRERRLWGWTALVVVAIYSTLGLARRLADELGRRELTDAAFGLGFVLILLAIVAFGVGTRPRGLEIGVTLGVVAVYALAFVRMATPAERTHLVEYGVVAILVHEALTERHRNGRGVGSPAVVAVGLTIAIGAIDEFIQLAIPSRVFDVVDIFANSVSAALAVVAKSALTAIQRRTRLS